MKIEDIKKWFEIAKPNPTIEDACVQIGCHYEEVGEMATATGDMEIRAYCEDASYYYKRQNVSCLSDLGLLTQGDAAKTELLDALCDQVVTAIGVAHMLGMDIEGALDEVNKSNHSKFEDGKAVFDENGKIRKGKDYFPPDLTKFI